MSVLFRLFPRLEVAGVELEGLESEPDLGDLRTRLLQQSELKAGDPLEVDELAAAAERLSVLLRSEGYLWASVEPEASFRSPTATVVFHIDPGVRARVGALTIDGVPTHIEAHVRRELALAEGAPYSRRELDRKIESLALQWKELGYYSARVSVEETPAENQRVDVRITPTMGPRVRIEVGGWDFSDKEIRKLVPLFSEARFTEDLVEESRVNLEEDLKDEGTSRRRGPVERETVGERGPAGPSFSGGARSEVRGRRDRDRGAPGGFGRGSAEPPRHYLSTASTLGSISREDVGQAISRKCGPTSRARVSIRPGWMAWSGVASEDEGLVTLVLRVEEGPRAARRSGRAPGGRRPSSRRAVLEAARAPAVGPVRGFPRS